MENCGIIWVNADSFLNNANNSNTIKSRRNIRSQTNECVNLSMCLMSSQFVTERKIEVSSSGICDKFDSIYVHIYWLRLLQPFISKKQSWTEIFLVKKKIFVKKKILLKNVFLNEKIRFFVQNPSKHSYFPSADRDRNCVSIEVKCSIKALFGSFHKLVVRHFAPTRCSLDHQN